MRATTKVLSIIILFVNESALFLYKTALILVRMLIVFVVFTYLGIYWVCFDPRVLSFI